MRSVQAQLRARMLEKDSLLRYVDPHQAHLTLAFLGATQPERVESIGDGLATVATGREPIPLAAGGFGAFPEPRSPRVLWIGLEGALAALLDIHARVGAALVPLGYVPDSRPFAAHITLARVRESASVPERRAIGIAFGAIWGPTVPCPIERIALYRSDLERGSPVYTPLRTVTLDG